MIKNFFTAAWRNLVKNRMLSIVNITGLTIGVSVCLLIGVWLQRELSFDNFHRNGKQIFRLTNTFTSESESFSQAPSGPAFGAHLPKQLSLIGAACRCFQDQYKIKAGNNQFFESNVLIVDSNFFQFFTFPTINGEPDKALVSPDQIVLTEKMAVKYFGHDDPIGKSMLIDGEYPMTIAAVAKDPPVNSHIQFDFLFPYSFLRKLMREHWKFDPDTLWLGGWPNVYVQLTNPTRWKEAEQQINRTAFKFEEKDWKANKMSYQYHLQPLDDIHLKSRLRYDADNNGSLARVNIFSIVGIIVLLLACINYINLTTAGAIKRARETSVRKVIGATRGQLIRQFFLETFIICALSVFLGVLVFKITLPWFSQWIGQPYDFPLRIVNLLLIAAFVLCVSFISGIYPASVLSSFNPAVSLKGNFLQSARGNIIRKALVVFQFTITVALIASILIINRQMDFIKNKSLGFNGNAVVEVNFNGEPKVIERYGSIRNELMQSPYILNVSKHNQNVIGGLGNGWTTTENLKGEEISTSLYSFAVDTNYLDTYSMKLAAGRFFSRDIPTDTTKSVLVNEAAVKTFGWQKPENAIGKRFGKGDDTRYVIGVVKDFNFENLHKPVEALMIGYSRKGGRLSLKIDPTRIHEAINHLEKTWSALLPEVPLQYSFVDEKVLQQYGNEQKMQGVFWGFSVLSLLIACLGLFGLSTFVVERKVKEIGIRKVLGANISGIVGLLSKDFLKLVLIAILVATPVAWYVMNKWLSDFAYRINIGWAVFVIAGVVAILIALMTVSFKAIKAAIANPVKSLRTE